MPLALHDTIAALASPPGPAFRGIVRLSGPEVRESLSGLFRPDNLATWETSVLPVLPVRHSGCFWLDEIGRDIPVSLYLWPTPRSYTGQPMAEIHAIGSPPLLEAMLAALYAGGVRPARAGEFTLRSFLAGKIDLVQAEAVLGVIDADDHVQLNRALAQLAGGISGRIGEIRVDLIALLADLEAGLDFADEDIDFISAQETTNRLARAEESVTRLLDQAAQRMRSTGAARIVLAGPPNAGKSTLFNALAGRAAALVSATAGTTRDYLTAELTWHGRRVELIDTAGLESAAEGPLQTALEISDVQLKQADLILWCTPIDQPDTQTLDAAIPVELPKLHVLTKSDLCAAPPADEIAVSATTGAGLENLTTAVVARLSQASTSRGELLGTTGARCRDSLLGTVQALQQAQEIAEAGLGEELLSIEVRTALDELGKVSGAVYTDDILDRIFSKFCIGK